MFWNFVGFAVTLSVLIALEYSNAYTLNRR